MSDYLDSILKLAPLTAALGYNDGANNGFWRHQWRDGHGRWAEMGRGVLGKLRLGDGSIANVRGVYVGSSDKHPGLGRVLVEGQSNKGIPDGIYYFSSPNAEVFNGTIPVEELLKQGIKTKGNSNGTLERQNSDIQSLATILHTPITPEDRKLATDVPNKKQKEIIKAERAKADAAAAKEAAKAPATPAQPVKTQKANVVPSETPTTAPAKDANSDIVSKLWNDAAYGKGANLDQAVKEAKLVNNEDNSNNAPFGIKPLSREKNYALDLKQGDFIRDPQTDEVLKLDGAPDWNADRTAITVPAVDSNGNRRDIQATNNQRIDKVADFRAADTTPQPAKTPEIVTPKPETTNVVPNTASDIKASDVAAGDTLYANGEKLGVVDNNTDAVDLNGKPAKRIRYTDDQGTQRSMIVKKDALVTTDKTSSNTSTPSEAPAPVETPTPATPPVEAPVAKVDMNSDQGITDIRSMLEKADASKGANPEYYKAAYATLSDPALSNDQKLSELAKVLRSTSLTQGGGEQKSTTRQLMDRMNRAGVPEASPEYAAKLREKANAPAAPAAPVVRPATVTPTAPSTPNETPRVMDDGSLIPQPNFTKDEADLYRNTPIKNLLGPDGKPRFNYDINGDPVNAADPNEMLNFMATVFPGSMFTPDGQLVLTRQRQTENGKNTEFEIRGMISGDKEVMYAIKLTNLDTGETKEYLHYDSHDSIQALFKKTKGSDKFGIDTIADIITGVQIRKTGNSSTANAKDIFGRANYLLAQGRLRTVEEQALYYANGVAERINPKTGTLLETGVPAAWDAYHDIASAPTADAAVIAKINLRDRLRAVAGHVPIDTASQDRAMAALREEFKRQNPGIDQRPINAHITTAFMDVRRQQFNNSPSRGIPYSSKDRTTPIQQGMVVQYEPNVGRTSVLRVTKLNELNTANPTQSADTFQFADYVNVVDSEGNYSVLPTTNLLILKDQGTPLTPIQRRLEGKAMRESRGVAEPSAIAVSEPGGPDDQGGPVEHLVPGSNFYSKTGDFLGNVVEMQPIIGKDGTPGYAVLFMDSEGNLKKAGVAAGEIRTAKK